MHVLLLIGGIKRFSTTFVYLLYHCPCTCGTIFNFHMFCCLLM